MRRYGLFLVKNKWPLALVLIGVLTAAGLALPRLDIDLSIVPILRSSEKARKNLKDFRRKVPPIRVDLLCLIEWPEPINMAHLDKVALWERAFQKLPQVRETQSLASIKVIERRGVLPLPTPFIDLARASSIEAQVARHPLARGLLISHHGRALAISFRRQDCSNRQLLDACRSAAAEIIDDPRARVRMIGAPLIGEAMRSSMIADMKQVIVLEVLCFVILLPIMFRTLRGLVIPVSVVLCGVVLSFGSLVWLGRSINIIGVSIPGLIAVIGLCDAIHMLHHFEELLSEGKTRDEAVVGMLERVGLACFYTSFTTAIGFASLAIADHDAVVDFAISASLAVAIAFLIVISLTPLALAFWPIKGAGRGGAFLSQKLGLRYGRRRLTIALSLGVVLASLLGLRSAVIDSHWLEELPAEDPSVKDFLWFEEVFNGFVVLEVEVRGPVDQLETFEALERIQRRIEKERGVKATESYADWVREALGQPAQVQAADLKLGLALLEGAGDRFPSHILRRERDGGAMAIRVRELGTRHFMGLVKLVEDEARSLPQGTSLRVGAAARLAHESASMVVMTMMQSLGASVIAISLFIALIFRSWKLGLASIVPNVLPLLVALGLNGWLGIELRVGIVMIYCAGLGLAVDDTIHLFARVRLERADDPAASSRDVILRALSGTGKALITTSIVLAVGALCYLPSSFKTMRDVGLLLAPIIMSALLADLYLLPFIIELVDRPEAPAPKA